MVVVAMFYEDRTSSILTYRIEVLTPVGWRVLQGFERMTCSEVLNTVYEMRRQHPQEQYRVKLNDW